MNRSSFALFVALLIHLLFLLTFWILGSMMHEIKKPIEDKENRIKISLKEMPKKTVKQEEISSITRPKINKIPPMPYGKQLKKIIPKQQQTKVKSVEKPLIKYQKLKPKKVIPKKIPKVIKKIKNKIEPIPPTKPYIPVLPKKKIIKKYDSYDWLLDDKSSQEIKKKKPKIQSKNSINNSDIKELYGSVFGKLSAAQQKYILDNQEIMRRITQEVLNRVARVNLTKNININRVNIIEFYLHPNGDMTDFKFLKKSGYFILDQTTQETIEYAYSKYPPTSEKTLIRYNVFYNLMH